MGIWRRKQRALALALAAAVLASLVLVQASGLAVADQEILYNGSFERGFASIPGCGQVGKGWGCFTNGGSAAYGFYDDQWAPVVAHGKNAQLIEINTLQYAASEADRYAGIFQTVRLVRGAKYTLSLKGLMRERNPNPDEDKYRYRVQWGYTHDGSTDWTQVDNWEELPWDKIGERTAPSGLQSFRTSFVAPSGKITIFFRAWKKWGNAYKELDVDLDAISLMGRPYQPGGKGTIVVPPASDDHGAVVIPPAGKKGGGVVVVPPKQPDTGRDKAVVVPPKSKDEAPASSGAKQAPTCTGPNYIKNGSFEQGFTSKGVGNYWTGFNNDRSTNYAYYDEQWSRVIKDGKHGQLMEINTKGISQPSENRYIGIAQVVAGLKPGATYEFSMWGLMREEMAHPEEDAFRYRVQWGYAVAGPKPSSDDITKWTDVPWNDIYLRTNPGKMLPFSVQFRAPSSKIVIGVRAVKKWATAERELDVNLDAIRLVDCGSPTPPKPEPRCQSNCDSGPVVIPPGHQDDWPKPPEPGRCVYYKVRPGDTLSSIAARYGTTWSDLAHANGIKNANRIYVGQLICVK